MSVSLKNQADTIISAQNITQVQTRFSKKPIDTKRIFLILLGIAIFVLAYFMPFRNEIIDINGKHIILTNQGRAAIALFCLASIWWIFEVVPIGITALAVAVLQILLMIRDARTVLTDFFDPSIWFIISIIIISFALKNTGLIQRVSYKILLLFGENSRVVYLACFTLIAVLSLFIPHTAIAAAMFPLLMSISSIYDDSGKPTRFAKGLFIGMAFSISAGSISTFFGSARAVIGAGLFKQITSSYGKSVNDISLFHFSYYMLPVSFLMIILIWLYISFAFKPEIKSIKGLKDRTKMMSKRLGPMKKNEIITLILILTAILFLVVKSFLPSLEYIDKSAVMLITVILFFIFNILAIKELEELPWNMIFLYGGAISLAYALYQTGASQWIAVGILPVFNHNPWFLIILCLSILLMVSTNFLFNVVLISLVLPVGLILSVYIGISPEIILFTTLTASGMPFLMLIGASQNAIAYESRYFKPKEFLKAGIPLSITLLIVISLFAYFIWQAMGMKI